ncbi:MAG: hypothetical protein D6675_01325 [Gemmatimonadetes bacterium]|nr:MAG: hypothetical protein D6675_01325 [Gemmatimonadota bacterium]
MLRVFLVFLVFAICVLVLRSFYYLMIGIQEKQRGQLRGGRNLKTTGSRYLCDTCKYDYGTVCTRSERPNAVTCPDYKPR